MTTETIVTVTKPNNKAIESDEVLGLYDEITEKMEIMYPNAKYLVRGDIGLDLHWTLKGFQQEELNFEDYVDYFNNRVSNPGKFEKFTQLIFFVHV